MVVIGKKDNCYVIDGVPTFYLNKPKDADICLFLELFNVVNRTVCEKEWVKLKQKNNLIAPNLELMKKKFNGRMKCITGEVYF